MPRYIPIDDADDPRIQPYRDVRERDLVGRDGFFIAEGEVVLNVLATSARFAIASCLIAETRLNSFEPLLATLPEKLDVFVASKAVMNTVAGFDIHRGVLALGVTPAAMNLEALLGRLSQRAIVVAAIGIANHDNIGGIFRNAAAFGVDAVLLDRTSCDPLYRKAIRVSVGGVFRVPFHKAAMRTEGGDPFADALLRHGFERLALSPAASEQLSDYRRPNRVALYLGAEGPGLPASILSNSRCVGIAMAPGFDSLNVATSAGIALHHLTRQQP